MRRSPFAHPSLTLLTRCECLKRHGVGEREGELGADFISIDLPRAPALEALALMFGGRDGVAGCWLGIPGQENPSRQAAMLSPRQVRCREFCKYGLVFRLGRHGRRTCQIHSIER